MFIWSCRSNHAPVEPQNLAAILHKDAIYNAVGLAAFDLYDEIDFDAWLTSSLSLELQVKVDIDRTFSLLIFPWRITYRYSLFNNRFPFSSCEAYNIVWRG